MINYIYTLESIEYINIKLALEMGILFISTYSLKPKTFATFLYNKMNEWF